MNRRTLPTVALLAVLALSCAGPTTRPELVRLGPVEDVLEAEAAPLAELVARWPATFLIGDARELEELLAARAALAPRAVPGELVTIVDAVGLDALQRPAIDAALVEAALEDGGPLVVDDGDGVARRLSGVADRPTLVRVAEGGAVLARVAVDAAGDADLAAALGEG